MKKTFYSKAFLLLLGLCLTVIMQAQVIFTSVPDTVAILNSVYSYDVEATYSPDAPTYSLQQAPAWMSINSSTGLITGTPNSMAVGGKVIVRAVNNFGEYFQTFYVYISDAVVCDPSIVAYWPMDNKVGTSLPDVAQGLNARWRGTIEPVPTIESDAVVGSSIKFDPVHEDDEFYSVAAADSFQFRYNDDFSVSFWFKNQDSQVDPTRHEVIIGRGDAAGARWAVLWNFVTKKIEFFLMDGSTDRDTLVSGPTISDNNWHHVVATFDGKHDPPSYDQDSYFQLYVDKSVVVGAFDFYTENFYMTSEPTIGWDNVYNYPYSGYLDEVIYYEKHLTSSDVNTLYNMGMNHLPVCQPGQYAPIITSQALTAATEDSPYSYQLTYRKMSGTTVVLSAPQLPSWLSFNTTTGILSGTPTNDNVGNHNVTVRLTSGSVVIDQQFTVNVANVNDLPVISSTPDEEIDEDANYSYTVTATDADAGATLIYSAPVLPAWMNFNTSTHVLSGTPTNAVLGTAASVDFDVTLRVTDNTAAYIEQTFTVTVNQVNDAPVINSQNALSVDEDNAIDITLGALNVVDVDNVYPDDFSVTVKDGDNYTHTGNTVTPVSDWNGNLEVSIELSDGEAIVSDVLTVTVNSINDKPEFTSLPGSLTVTAGSNFEYWITCTDAEGQNLTITVPTKPTWLNFTTNGNSGLLQGTPSNSHAGTANVSINVTDGDESATQSFDITVNFNTGVQEVNTELASVYPNPASDAVYFTFTEKPTDATLEVFSMNGLLIKKVSISGINIYKLDVTDLHANQYLYRILNDGKEQKGYLVVQ